jgi:hypothetical protein
MKVDWDVIDKLAQNIRHAKPVTVEIMREQLDIWWSVKFNRPLKDPLLQEYSTQELLYEYLIHHYLDPKNDPTKLDEEEARKKDDIEWAQKMMANMNKSKEEKAEGDQEDTKEEPGPGTDGMFVTPTNVPDVPFPDLPDTISTHFDE